jgi:hypothetical protein
MRICTKGGVILVTMVSGGMFFAAATCTADPLFYAVTSKNDFGTLDPLTGTFSYISTLSITVGSEIVGIGFAANGNLYGLDTYPQGLSTLFQFNTNNGAVIEHIFPSGPHAPSVEGNGFGMTGSPNGTLFA